ncbi:MAG: Lrp/AsnC ligand binding domain-containing protein [Victivallales bacterium]|jgi:DNA-binding Lrp family transcriptional regulator|nr:Lrp/AsnC ligand binding domain-containing protein [Victivallales bacterium]MBT7299936.1 Lrp/AsnC ligand binding domain-containing protein [Victivallales bacterium]
MVTAFVLIHCHGRDPHEVAAELVDLDGVTELHLVAGEYDMVCVVRVADNQRLSQLITKEVVKAAGVARTKTLFSLESLSKFDLDSMFGTP